MHQKDESRTKIKTKMMNRSMSEAPSLENYSNSSKFWYYNVFGLYCGDKCKWFDSWCHSASSTSCDVEGTILQPDNKELCQENIFWKDHDCTWYLESGDPYIYGTRCQGSMQHCMYAWYYNHRGVEDSARPQSCVDKSDQVMYQESTCPSPTAYVQLHNDAFRYDPDDYLSWYQIGSDDPHKCQKSCSTPGPGCTSCTNETYFQCSLSGLCLHPDMQCDGHSQCPFAEDENLNVCFERWVGAKLVSQYASLKCSGTRHPGMNILSIPCDGIVECSDGQDEAHCKSNSIGSYLLIGSCTGIIIFYLALRLLRGLNKIQEKNILRKDKKHFDEVIEAYTNDNENAEKIKKVNTLLLGLINLEEMEVQKQKAIQFYKNEAKIHANNESAIFISMHRKLDPAITQVVHDSKFPGLKQKTIGGIQKTFKTNCITNFQNLLIKNEKVGQTVDMIITLVKIFSSYVDLFKDSFLACSLLLVVGGPASIFAYPTQFTSVIVMVMWASIIMPLMASTLDLIFYNPFLLVNYDASRSFVVFLCLVCWIINPILLRHRYESAQEKIIRMLKSDPDNDRVLLVRAAERKVKAILVQFYKIELGMYKGNEI